MIDLAALTDSLTGCTDEELEQIAVAVRDERLRRASLDRAPDRLVSVFADFAARGGDCLALADEAQRLAAEHPGEDES